MLVDSELREIARKIVNEQKTAEGWAEIESSDMFQSDHYCGGFDADESAFCFSYFGSSDEYWFQFSLDEAVDIAAGRMTLLSARRAEDIKKGR